MSRASFLGLFVFVLVLTGLISLHGSLLALSMPMILYWAYSLWRGPDEIALEVERELKPDRAAAQAPVMMRLTVTNLGGDLEELALEDLIPPALKLVSGSPHHMISLSKAQTFAFEYEVQGPRGAYPFERLLAEAGDHLGLLQLRKDIRTPGQLSVLPLLPRIREVRIRPRRTRVYAGTIPARVGGAGVEFFGVRPYLPGDSPRRVNWRVSARHRDELYSNEFQQERVADVAIVLDGRERSNLYAEGHSLFEHSVLAAGSMADALLQQGNRVGLLVYSQYLQWTMPGYGKIQRQRILQALARAAPGASQIFEGLQYLPARLFPAESQIILVSPLIDEDYSTLVQLRARGYQVMVVSPDPVGFERRLLPRPGAKYSASDVELSARIAGLERAWMLRRVRGAGIRVIEWDVLQPFDQVTRTAFSRASDMRHRL
jgi:uncharacterized protein (DUF58 family)